MVTACVNIQSNSCQAVWSIIRRALHYSGMASKRQPLQSPQLERMTGKREKKPRESRAAERYNGNSDCGGQNSTRIRPKPAGFELSNSSQIIRDIWASIPNRMFETSISSDLFGLDPRFCQWRSQQSDFHRIDSKHFWLFDPGGVSIPDSFAFDLLRSSQIISIGRCKADTFDSKHFWLLNPADISMLGLLLIICSQPTEPSLSATQR